MNYWTAGMEPKTRKLGFFGYDSPLGDGRNRRIITPVFPSLHKLLAWARKNRVELEGEHAGATWEQLEAERKSPDWKAGWRWVAILAPGVLFWVLQPGYVMSQEQAVVWLAWPIISYMIGHLDGKAGRTLL